MKQYAILAHAIKGDVRMLGADAFGELAYQHEMAGKEENRDFVEAHLQELLENFDQAREGFRMICREASGNSGEAASGSGKEVCEMISVKKLFQTVREAISCIRDFHEEKGAELIKDILKYPLAASDRRIFEDAVYAVEKEFDPDKAEALLESMIG